MMIIEQVAMRTDDMESQLQGFATMGHLEWVRDRVEAVHLYRDESVMARLGEHFQVELAFNYTFIPNVEFELIQLMHGQTWQLMDTPSHRISHFGYHTVKDQADNGQTDSLLEELRMLQLSGLTVMQVSQTVAHRNTQRRYRYAFATGQHTGGVAVKVIQRLLPKAAVNDGMELFACLTR